MPNLGLMKKAINKYCRSQTIWHLLFYFDILLKSWFWVINEVAKTYNDFCQRRSFVSLSWLVILSIHPNHIIISDCKTLVVQKNERKKTAESWLKEVFLFYFWNKSIYETFWERPKLKFLLIKRQKIGAVQRECWKGVFIGANCSRSVAHETNVWGENLWHFLALMLTNEFKLLTSTERKKRREKNFQKSNNILRRRAAVSGVEKSLSNCALFFTSEIRLLQNLIMNLFRERKRKKFDSWKNIPA